MNRLSMASTAASALMVILFNSGLPGAPLVNPDIGRSFKDTDGCYSTDTLHNNGNPFLFPVTYIQPMRTRSFNVPSNRLLRYHRLHAIWSTQSLNLPTRFLWRDIFSSPAVTELFSAMDDLLIPRVKQPFGDTGRSGATFSY